MNGAALELIEFQRSLVTNDYNTWKQRATRGPWHGTISNTAWLLLWINSHRLMAKLKAATIAFKCEKCITTKESYMIQHLKLYCCVHGAWIQSRNYSICGWRRERACKCELLIVFYLWTCQEYPATFISFFFIPAYFFAPIPNPSGSSLFSYPNASTTTMTQ